MTLSHVLCCVWSFIASHNSDNPDTNCSCLSPPLISLFYSFMQKRPAVYAHTSGLFYVHIYILTFKTVPWSLLSISLTSLALRNKWEMRKRPKRLTMALQKPHEHKKNAWDNSGWSWTPKPIRNSQILHNDLTFANGEHVSKSIV